MVVKIIMLMISVNNWTNPHQNSNDNDNDDYDCDHHRCHCHHHRCHHDFLLLHQNMITMMMVIRLEVALYMHNKDSGGMEGRNMIITQIVSRLIGIKA